MTSLGQNQLNRLLICNKRNLPGNSFTCINKVAMLLDSSSFPQHVSQQTRCNATSNHSSLLALIITSRSLTQPPVHISCSCLPFTSICLLHCYLSADNMPSNIYSTYYTHHNIGRNDAVVFEKSQLALKLN